MNVKAGWYPDTGVPGGERYWDGERWTTQRRPAQGPAPAATAAPAAGWYDDPKLVNTRRYWDGARWTEHRQEKPAPPATPSAAAGPASESSFWTRPLTLGGAIVVVLIAIWLIYGGGRNVWSGAETVDEASMELEIEQGLADQGVKDVTLSCTPYADQVEQGDSTVCAGETADGTKVSVLVTFNSDGSYIWEQQ